MRAQVAVEYLAIVALALFALVAIWMYVSFALGDSRYQANIDSAKGSLQRIKDSTNVAYHEGAPSKATLTVFFPEAIAWTCVGHSCSNGTDTSRSPRDISLFVSTPYGVTEVSATALAVLNGSLDTFSGQRTIVVEALPDGRVNVIG